MFSCAPPLKKSLFGGHYSGGVIILVEATDSANTVVYWVHEDKNKLANKIIL